MSHTHTAPSPLQRAAVPVLLPASPSSSLWRRHHSEGPRATPIASKPYDRAWRSRLGLSVPVPAPILTIPRVSAPLTLSRGRRTAPRVCIGTTPLPPTLRYRRRACKLKHAKAAQKSTHTHAHAHNAHTHLHTHLGGRAAGHPHARLACCHLCQKKGVRVAQARLPAPHAAACHPHPSPSRHHSAWRPWRLTHHSPLA